MGSTAPRTEQLEVRAVSELEGLVGDDVPAYELVRLHRIDALLRSLPGAAAAAHPKPTPNDAPRSSEMNDNHPTKRRILMVADHSAEGSVLLEAIRELVRSGEAEVLVVVPARKSRLGFWTLNDDKAIGATEDRLRRCLEVLEGAGIEANGVVGDADPLRAIADALHGFPADELVIATHAETRSHWLGRELHLLVAPSRHAVRTAR
jgi:hypothetical protein